MWENLKVSKDSRFMFLIQLWASTHFQINLAFALSVTHVWHSSVEWTSLCSWWAVCRPAPGPARTPLSSRCEGTGPSVCPALWRRWRCAGCGPQPPVDARPLQQRQSLDWGRGWMDGWMDGWIQAENGDAGETKGTERTEENSLIMKTWNFPPYGTILLISFFKLICYWCYLRLSLNNSCQTLGDYKSYKTVGLRTTIYTKKPVFAFHLRHRHQTSY